MASSVKAIPEGMHTVTPHLVCANALEAMDWYTRAFGAVDMGRMLGPDGKLMHGMMRLGDGHIMLGEENMGCGAAGPKTLNGSPVTLHLYVEDADKTFADAIAAGATSRMAVEEMFWGDRYGVLQDPWGHSWSVATHVKDLTDEEIKANMAKMFG